MSHFHISYETGVSFPAPPRFVWDSLKKVELFESWWQWIEDVELDGEALTEGSTISFTIDPPVPYRMAISVLVTDATEGKHLEGRVTGDLDGTAFLTLSPEGDGSRVRVGWDVEIASPVIRPVIRIARPVLVWAQGWAVQVALRGFRRYLAEQGYPAH
ncbi:MAG: SRPBCC family protein [Actinomycetota bacterium]